MTEKALDMLRVLSVEDIVLDTGGCVWWNLQASKLIEMMTMFSNNCSDQNFEK